MKILKIILIPILTVGILRCQSTLPKDTQIEKFPPVASCSNLPPAQQFSCIPQLLTRSELIFNDEGRVIKLEKIASDAECSRYSMTFEIGDLSLPKEQRLQRTIRFSSCSGSFWTRLSENALIGGVSFGAGFITGIILGILK